MNNSPELKSALALAALELHPPLVQDTLLDDKKFKEEYGIKLDGVLSIGEANCSFSSSVLCGAVQRVLSSTQTEKVTDKEGREWKVENIGRSEELPNLFLSGKTERFALAIEFVGLSENRSARLVFLDKAASDVNLPKHAYGFWRGILHDRPLDDYEVLQLQADRLDTPVANANTIEMEFDRGEANPSTMVPPSRRYFERLVGKYDGSSSISNYAGGTVKVLFERLATWRPVEGLRLSLILSAHHSLPDQINVDHLERDDLLGVFEYIAEYGDRISQLGAVELGFRILKSRPEVEPALCRLIREIREDGDSEQAKGFKLLSALFWFVDGEISRMRLFTDEPPFYRRLAALSQAALIYGQLVELRVDPKPFSDWALGWPPWHYQQSFVDLRLEPRWRPEFASESQLKADFFGRILVAGRRFEENIKGTDIYDQVFGEGSNSLESVSNPIHAFLPGPLEGSEESGHPVPAEVLERLEAELEAEETPISAFLALTNVALIYRLDRKYPEWGVNRLKRHGYRLGGLEDKEQLIAVAYGLATVAAVSRSPELADQLRILCRRYRRDGEYSLSIEETLVVCLVAAASRPGLEEWMEYVGDWLTEFAFGELENKEGRIVHAWLTGLCHAVPELWTYCGRAEAALKAFNAR